MNTRTRGEKIDEFLTNVKRTFVIALLVIWGVLTMFLGIGFAANRMEAKELTKKIEKMEKEKKESKETTYVVVDGHKYEVIDTAY